MNKKKKKKIEEPHYWPFVGEFTDALIGTLTRSVVTGG